MKGLKHYDAALLFDLDGNVWNLEARVFLFGNLHPGFKYSQAEDGKLGFH